MMEKKQNAQESQSEVQTSILDLAIAEIARDAALDPKAYLEQTIVPEGGE